jgi:hypothetical protein
VIAVVVLALALLARAAWAWRPSGATAAVVAVLVLGAVLGEHLMAVVLLAVVTVICGALGVLLSAIAEVVVESGWGVQPYQPWPRRSGERP